jgi:hypothetical protein
MDATDTLLQVTTDRRMAILLEHIGRYRLTTFAALRRWESLDTRRPREIRRLLQACQAQALIDSAWLHQGMRYWHLATAGAARLGLPASAAGPLSEPAKVRAYALLRFCCLSAQMRLRLTTGELAAPFPDLDRWGLPQGYYFNPAGAGRLGFARIDVGQPGRWDRIVETVRQDISAHLLQSGFRRLIHAGRFEISVLTVLPQKARRLCAALHQQRDAQRIPVQIVALPDLLPLIASLPERR